MEHLEEEDAGQSRLFVILSIALIGLLVLGLLGIGGVFVVRQNMEEQALATQPTATLFVRLPAASPTSLPTQVIVATSTVAPTPTNTPVVSVGSGGSEAASNQTTNRGGEVPDNSGDGENDDSQNSPTATPSPSPTPPSAEIANATEVPNTGLGAFESIAIALGLIFVFFISRRLRMSTT